MELTTEASGPPRLPVELVDAVQTLPSLVLDPVVVEWLVVRHSLCRNRPLKVNFLVLFTYFQSNWVCESNRISL